MASWLLEVQRRLGSPPPRRLALGDARPAAVLVPLYVDGGELWTVLTRRTDELPAHRGQFAFPGGGREVGEEAWTAALRESEEELGIEPRTVMRLGELDEVDTSTGFRIVPCVGAIPAPGGAGPQMRPNPLEIAEVLPLPLSAFADPQLVEEREVRLDGVVRRIRVYHLGSRQIWGATARVLENLLDRLGLDGGRDDRSEPDEAS
jgi:8-oxo-dGTP pyrophosphatase MutT (NUDIX family)